MRNKRPSYNPEDPLSINVSFWCEKKGYNIAFMACPACDKYVCSQLTAADVDMLNRSPLMVPGNLKFTETYLGRKRKRMWIAELTDGTLKVLEGFDDKNPDSKLLEGVSRVYGVNKILQPRLSLAPLPKDERDKLLNDAGQQPVKKQRSRTAADHG